MHDNLRYILLHRIHKCKQFNKILAFSRFGSSPKSHFVQGTALHYIIKIVLTMFCDRKSCSLHIIITNILSLRQKVKLQLDRCVVTDDFKQESL